MASQTEKGLAHHIDKCRRAYTAGDRIEEKESKGEDSEEDAIMQRELSRLVASKGNDPPFWMLEPDLAGLT